MQITFHKTDTRVKQKYYVLLCFIIFKTWNFSNLFFIEYDLHVALLSGSLNLGILRCVHFVQCELKLYIFYIIVREI